MKSQTRYIFFILLILALLLSACGPEDLQEIEDILDPDNAEPSEAQKAQQAGEGGADVYYHYHMKSLELDFEIDMPFHITFAELEKEPGTWNAWGMNEDWIEFTMLGAGGPTGSCTITCSVYGRYEAIGKITMSKNGDCQIPMQFNFVPTGDNFIDGDCPQEAQDLMDCALLSTVVMDPGVYTFSGKDPDPQLSKDLPRREAEIKNLKLPSGMAGTCKW